MHHVLSLAFDVCALSLVVCLQLRLQAFPRIGRQAVLAAAVGMFISSKYMNLATTVQDDILATAAAMMFGYFGLVQFRIYPRTTM